MYKKVLGIILVILILEFQVAFADGIAVDGKGLSRNDAISDGFKNAVAQALGLLVDTKTLDKNYQAVSDEIYTRSREFVQDYRVLSESSIGSDYVVKMQVKINTNPDSTLYTTLQRLKLIEAGSRDPRIGVFISNMQPGSNNSALTSEAAVIQKLRESGYNHIIDTQQIEGIENGHIAQALVDGDTETAEDIACANQIDYVISGYESVQCVGHVSESDMFSSCADININILKVDTGEVVAAREFQAAEIAITPKAASQKALSIAGAKAGNFAAKRLTKYISAPDKTMFLVVFQADFNKLKTIEASLKHMPNVERVCLRSYRNNVAQFDIVGTSSSKHIADVLQKIAGINFGAVQISNNTVQVIVK